MLDQLDSFLKNIYLFFFKEESTRSKAKPLHNQMDALTNEELLELYFCLTEHVVPFKAFVSENILTHTHTQAHM